VIPKKGFFMTRKIPRKVAEKVLEELTSARNMDNIVAEVCEATDLDWEQAESFVNHLAAKNEDSIILSQSPVLVLLALFTFVSGVFIVLYDLYQFYLVYSADSETFLFQMLFWGMNSQGFFWSFLFGVAMILGSLKGMEDVWGAIFEKFRKKP
jgi:hypothetical protein